MIKLSMDFLFDKRIISRNIKNGKLNKDDFKKYINSLSDLKNHCDDISSLLFTEKKDEKK
jgi:hypothetical protein